MKDEGKDERMEYRMKMWRMREEKFNSMGEKELRAFITGYMTAESMLLRKLSKKHGCSCGQHGGECGCGQECNCKGCSCNCENK